MNNSNYKIALIIPYFGQWPSYFNIYLKGCENNQWLDILFFTDCDIPNCNSSNVQFHKFSLKKFSELASKKLDLNINVTNAYKLCDFRPCYGLIFEDYINDYDYWGYGDIDLIYGKLKPFVIDRIDEGFDVLSNRVEILSGSLSFFKNTVFLKNLYSQSPLLVDQLFVKDYMGLDETAHDHTTWHGGDKSNLPSHCFTYLIANEHKKGTIKASFVSTCKENINKGEIISYLNGTIISKKMPLAYYHYVCNKNNHIYMSPNWKKVPGSFFITETGFYKSEKLYGFINNYRKIVGTVKSISIRIWKRLIKN